MDAFIRYRIINNCLRQKENDYTQKRWSWEELAAEIKAETGRKYSRKTIMDDIKKMREDRFLGYFAPIIYDKSRRTNSTKQKGFYYEDSNYSISETPLNSRDVEELSRLINLFKEIAGLNNLEAMQSAIRKLELVVYEHRQPHNKIVELEHPDSIPGDQYLNKLYEAIRKKEAITITYKKFQDGIPSSPTISPYLLKEYNNRWYLMAFNHAKKDIRTYGLERIKELKKTFQDFIEPVAFNPKEYFKNTIGITRKEEVETIVFKVYNTGEFSSEYIHTRKLHSSQVRIDKNEEYSLFKMEVRPDREFEEVVLSYGDFLEVLEPENVRDRIKNRIAKSYLQYNQ